MKKSEIVLLVVMLLLSIRLLRPLVRSAREADLDRELPSRIEARARAAAQLTDREMLDAAIDRVRIALAEEYPPSAAKQATITVEDRDLVMIEDEGLNIVGRATLQTGPGKTVERIWRTSIRSARIDGSTEPAESKVVFNPEPTTAVPGQLADPPPLSVPPRESR